MRRERWEALSLEEREGFVLLCPDAVFEVPSRHHSREELREKLRAYLQNGARLAVLLDPCTRPVELHRPGREPEVCAGPGQVDLSPGLSGFQLDVGPVFEG
ncbi:MAG: Uma2 family endonuclease [Armatimonadota bacterium]|nr:Uma2 family endonuclease [Armatimonadota bacterium]MDW8156306.1 Uma2 family endonuclease [Armatimonadota bacterium]